MRNIAYLLLLPFCLILGFLACGNDDDDNKGTTPVALEALFPADNKVGNWVIDTDKGKVQGFEKASNQTEVWDLINGDADPFTDKGFSLFGREYYKDTTTSSSAEFELELRVWVMTDEAAATAAWTYTLEKDSRYGSSVWEDLTVGDQGRIADAGSSWWINVRKGKYFVEAMHIRPNNQQLRTMGIEMVTNTVNLIQ